MSSGLRLAINRRFYDVGRFRPGFRTTENTFPWVFPGKLRASPSKDFRIPRCVENMNTFRILEMGSFGFTGPNTFVGTI
jgi:hypothetical protein